MPRQCQRRRAGIEHHGLAVTDQFGSANSDGVFLPLLTPRPSEKLEFKGNLFRRRRAAVRADDPSSVGEDLQIAADRHVADAQFARQALNSGLSLSPEQFLNLLMTRWSHCVRLCLNSGVARLL